MDSQLQNINSEASSRQIEPSTSEDLKRYFFLIVELWEKILLIGLDSFLLKVGEDIQLPLCFTIHNAKAPWVYYFGTINKIQYVVLSCVHIAPITRIHNVLCTESIKTPPYNNICNVAALLLSMIGKTW